MLTYAPKTAAVNEKLLQFIWLHRYYHHQAATTPEGEKIEVIYPGMLNTNQGPDFLQARIRIQDKVWAGNIEVHLRSSDWDAHGHSPDSNYDNVVLHVVWLYNKPAASLAARIIPVLELQPLVSVLMLQRYRELMEAPVLPGCTGHLPLLSDIGWASWKERLAVERLTRKSAEILELLAVAENHWEEVFWWLLARNFGMKVNAALFEEMARSIPVQVLGKHKAQIQQIEALLLGQANLLEQTFTGPYEKMLQKEYRFLRHKYQLTNSKAEPAFLRMRPAGFPTVRLAQLAMLIHQSTHLFSVVRDAKALEEVIRFFNITANDYWHYHYRLDEPAAYAPKKLGAAMTDIVVINTVVPVLFAYGMHVGDEAIKERAVAWLLQTAKEQNSIVEYWKQQGVTGKNAMDTQALIELKNNYCNTKRCLECAVGAAVLNVK